LALAAGLRFAALHFGLPYPHARPDEETAVGHAVAILRGDVNPHFFNWPSLTFYLFAAVLGAARLFVALTPAGQIVLARALVATAGALTVLPAASIARRIAGPPAGLAAALFLAVAPLHVRDSHFAVTDVLMTFLATSSMALAMRGRATANRTTFAAAGALAGLATSTKYNAAALLAIAVAAPSPAAAAWFAAAFAAAFVAGTPFALLDWRAFAADVAYERTHLSAGHAVPLGRGWIYHLHTTLPHGLGPLLALAAAAGFVLLATKYRKSATVVVLFTVVFYLAIGSGSTVFFRYVLPLVPVACVCAAVAVSSAGSRLAVVLAILVAAPSFYQSVTLDRLLARQDSRVIAGAWLAGQLRPESTVHDGGGDYCRLALDALPFHAWRYDPAARSFGAGDATPDWIVLDESPLTAYTATPDSLRDLVRDRYELALRVAGVPGELGEGVYDRQDAFFLPIDGFTGVARPGPTVLIYRRR